MSCQTPAIIELDQDDNDVFNASSFTELSSDEDIKITPAGSPLKAEDPFANQQAVKLGKELLAKATANRAENQKSRSKDGNIAAQLADIVPTLTEAIAKSDKTDEALLTVIQQNQNVLAKFVDAFSKLVEKL